MGWHLSKFKKSSRNRRNLRIVGTRHKNQNIPLAENHILYTNLITGSLRQPHLLFFFSKKVGRERALTPWHIHLYCSRPHSFPWLAWYWSSLYYCNFPCYETPLARRISATIYHPRTQQLHACTDAYAELQIQMNYLIQPLLTQLKEAPRPLICIEVTVNSISPITIILPCLWAS